MDNALMLAAFVAAIWIVFIFLRVPATILFFALMVGQLISQQLSDEAFDLLTQYMTLSDFRIVQLGLLLLPIAITMILLRGRTNKSKRIIEAGPLLLTAASIVIFADGYLAISQSLRPDQTALLQTYEGVIVSSGAVLSLVSSWLNYPKSHKDKHKKH